MKVAVIGSGHAAISAVAGLIEGGIKPTILDVGETLEPDIQARVDTLANSPPESWAETAEHFGAPPQTGRLPQKNVFGSDYLYARDVHFAPVHLNGTNAVPTFAKGGFSMGWGGTALPAPPEDLQAWPFPADSLNEYYVQALEDMPLAAEIDRLSQIFPLHQAATRAKQPTAQGAGLLADLERADAHLNQNSDQVLFGTARLALNNESCVRCGMCLTGCPLSLIYPLDKALDRLIAAGKVNYQSSAYVNSLEEIDGSVVVSWIDTATNRISRNTFDRVFVGAGALGSARIMLNSLRAYEQPVPVKDSAKFAIPLLRVSGADLEWPNTNTLAELFIEAVFPEISPRWLHIQVSSLNEMMLQAIGMRNKDKSANLNRFGRISKPLLSRLLVAWCALHSDLSSQCELSISLGPQSLPVLNISRGVGKNANRSTWYLRRYKRRLARMGLKFGTLFATPATMLSPACSTGHCGGSFPMRKRPEGPFETDTLGRLKGWDRVHLVDSSTFPTIPATTIALLIRANARRIVAETNLIETA